ncbi:MAG: hypothetical protein FWC97_12020 [Treponema sp.]|nr:hypothetical protein [Treponema sp.]
MKHKLRVIGIIALAVIIGFIATACDEDNNGGNNPPPLTAGLFAGILPNLGERVTDVEANDLQAVLDHVNANAADGHFTWILGENIAVDGSTTRALNQTDARLTIIGLGQERTISVTSNGRIFTLGAEGQTGISLTLGNNIALVGFNANDNGMVLVEQTAAFTMLAGSEIRGNTNSGNAIANNVGTAVYVVSGSSFTMLGGSITGNHSTTTENTARGGGLFASGAGTVITLAGGNITGNTAVWGGDMFVMDSVASFTLSGTASVGTVGLHAATNATAFTLLTVADDWTGTVSSLNLRGNGSTIAHVISWWNNRDVLTGPGVNAANVARIPLGNFVSVATSEEGRQPIAPTHHINAEGVLVANAP